MLRVDNCNVTNNASDEIKVIWMSENPHKWQIKVNL